MAWYQNEVFRRTIRLCVAIFAFYPCLNPDIAKYIEDRMGMTVDSLVLLERMSVLLNEGIQDGEKINHDFAYVCIEKRVT